MPRATKQLSVTLPIDMAKAVRTRVESGAYASESEVIRDGLRALDARERATEDWLRGDVAAAYDQMKSNPGHARTALQVRDSLEKERRRATRKG